VGCETAREYARRHESKGCKMECARQVVRDGARRVRQPAGGSRRCDTLRAASHTMLVERKKKKEQKDVPRSTKESRDSRGKVAKPWSC
jgi:hypothetical protein